MIGSNIFNIFLVLGCAATVRPLPFGAVGNADLLILTACCMLFWIFGYVYKERTITRWEGGMLAACYIGYMAWLVATA